MRDFILSLILGYMTISVTYSNLLLPSTPAFSRLTFSASDNNQLLAISTRIYSPLLHDMSTTKHFFVSPGPTRVFFPLIFNYHLRQKYRGFITLFPVSYCQPSNCLTNFYHLNIHLVSSTTVISCLHFCRRLLVQNSNLDLIGFAALLSDN